MIENPCNSISLCVYTTPRSTYPLRQLLSLFRLMSLSFHFENIFFVFTFLVLRHFISFVFYFVAQLRCPMVAYHFVSWALAFCLEQRRSIAGAVSTIPYGMASSSLSVVYGSYSSPWHGAIPTWSCHVINVATPSLSFHASLFHVFFLNSLSLVLFFCALILLHVSDTSMCIVVP